jgi:chromosome segregation ATPase
MGGSSSRELEAAQSQVRRLTGELQKASQQLKVQQSGAALKLAAEAAEQQLKKELQAKSLLLEKTTGELSTLRGVSAELPRFKQEVAAAKEAEMRARRAEADKGVLVSELQAQLMQSKADLEQLFGKLKFAEAEKGATLRTSASVSEDRRLLADQQREAAEASARLLAIFGALERHRQRRCSRPPTLPPLQPRHWRPWYKRWCTLLARAWPVAKALH